MQNKNITSFYDNIVSECDFPIDCKQGLYLSLLGCLGKNISYAGATWPWTFYFKPRLDAFDIEAKQLIDIKNALTTDSIKEIFDVELTYYYFTEYAEVIKCIYQNIKKDIPVIVNTDQYYIPYHKEFIYQHIHGLHATLLMGYNDEKEEALCFSVTPEYKGVIPYNELYESIINSAILWCAVMKPGVTGADEKTDEDVFLHFQRDIDKVLRNYEGDEKSLLEPNKQIYTKDILSAFSQCSEEDDEDTYHNLKALCGGRWGWEINTNINLFMKYLQTVYVRGQYKDIYNILRLIADYQQKWNLTYRKMYKMLRRRPQDIKKEIEVVTDNFKGLINCEKTIMKHLII
jgi:hypothetical protein